MKPQEKLVEVTFKDVVGLVLIYGGGVALVCAVFVAGYNPPPGSCRDQIPNPTCPPGIDLVVEDYVAVCRCLKEKP